jgi:hypothetical protein
MDGSTERRRDRWTVAQKDDATEPSRHGDALGDVGAAELAHVEAVQLAELVPIRGNFGHHAALILVHMENPICQETAVQNDREALVWRVHRREVDKAVVRELAAAAVQARCGKVDAAAVVQHLKVKFRG